MGTLKFHSSAVTFDATTVISGETYTDTIIQCKDITVTPPKGEAEKVDLLGTETVTIGAGNPITGVWQNAVYDEKSFSDGEMKCTLVLVGDYTNLPDFLKLTSGTGMDIGPNTYTRFGFGDSTSGQARVTTGAIVLLLNNGAEEVSVVLSSPVVNMGDIKPTGMDGHFELEFEAKCLPKGFAIEIKD